MRFKTGVDPLHLSAPAWYAAHIVDQLHQLRTGRQMVVTSTGEGRHSVRRSQHYTGAYGAGFGRAFDVRVWYLEDPADFAKQMIEKLGDDYVVLLEWRTDDNDERVPSHIHVDWSPVYRELN